MRLYNLSLFLSLFIFYFANLADAKVLKMRQLTGKHGFPHSLDFGDPSPPDFSMDNAVRVYTTSGHILVWKSKNGISAKTQFLDGKPPTYEKLDILDSDGRTEMGAWDPTIETFPEFNDQTFLYAGVMSAPEGEKYAHWPEDNWRRRVNAFTRVKEKNKKEFWQRIPNSIMREPLSDPTWVDHSYGHHLFRDDQKKVWMFYEKVTEERHGHPWKTEIFARRMLSPTRLAKKEYPILTLSDDSWPATRRSFGGVLVEGPRPFKIKEWYVIGFSAGDYMSDDYGMYLMASKSITGPYQVYLNRNQSDLKNFASGIESEHSLTWGAARPAFFETEGQLWVLFHGIPKSEHDQIELGQRNVYLAPVKVTTYSDRPPKIEVKTRL